MPSSSSVSSFSLVARDLARVRGPFTVLDAVDVSVGPRTRLGVVGPNGVGKTTLLRLLAGVDRPDRGTITATPPSVRVGYLPQEPERGDETLFAFLARRTGVAAAETELERAAAALADERQDGDAAADTYSAALDAYLAAGGPDLDARARAVGADLGLPEHLLDVPTVALSGGQAARASLAAILLSRFDVFLLDEPTNDLDFAGLERLETFLDDLPGGVVVVSHDRAFLERTVTRVLELDEHTRSATEFGGGWLGYVDARATARRHAEEDYAAYRAEKGRLEQRARTQREWAVQGTREGAARPVGEGQVHQALQGGVVGEAGSQGAGDREGHHPARRGREALGGVGSPIPARRARPAVATWSRGCAVRSCTEARSPSDRSTSRSVGASGSRSWAPTARGRRRSCWRCSGGSLSPPGSGGWVRA